MADPNDTFEKTWLALTLPDGAAGSLPLDATVMAAAGPRPAGPLPHISVSEAPAGGGGASSSIGPDLVVVGVLGEGGMGRVLVARQRSLERDVAVKRPRAGASARDAELLRAEAVVTGHLEHPNIIPVHALGVDDGGRPLIVMKRVDGVSWRDLLRDPDHPGWARREPNRDAREVWHLGILVQLCNAIAFAHSRGFVHRDMKPDNVMIGEFGEIYLIDWGVAVETGSRAITAAGAPLLIGTPAYMAPEMAEGGALDERTDVYLLGATLHEVLTGRVRHDGADLHAVTLQALASKPFDYGDEVADELAGLANRATARDPAARPPDALAFRQAISEHLLHRASLRLSDEAGRSLAELELASASRGGDAMDPRAIEECRFLFRQALREWPDNPDALRGIARLDAAALAEKEERARLRLLASDADSRIGGAARLVLVLILSILATAVTLYAVHLQARGQVGPSQLIALPSFLAAGSLIAIAITRRRVLINAFSRRLVAWFLVLMLGLVASRVVGQAIGLSPAEQFTVDGVLMTALLAAGAIYNFRWIWLCAAMTGGATVVCTLAPEVSLVAFGATASALPVVAVFLMRGEK